MYLPPYERFQQKIALTNFRGVPTATVPIEDLKSILRMLLNHVLVNEAWYLSRYPDVAAAIDRGMFASARAHFAAEGYFEGRRPFPVDVDEAWYLAQYPEVEEAIRAGHMRSAQQHFDEHGYREGRLPGPPEQW